MLSSRWQCSRCLGRFVRTAAKPQIRARFQSTLPKNPAEELISPGLLERARAVADEHTQLAKANAENYDLSTAKRIGELGPVTSALKEYEEAQSSLGELRALLDDPSSDSELRTLAESDIESTAATIPILTDKLKSSLIPVHPFVHLPCMLEIHPGAGGSEASIFAHDLLEMYQALCQRLNFPSTLVSYSSDDSVPSGATGLTDCILEITQPGSYDLLRSEAGVHRVQRIPATEKKGRTHTSAVSVLVLPSFPETASSDSELNFEDPNSDYYISPADVKSEVMRARGAGGQHVNKTESAVRLTHIPTGIVVGMQDSRSQHKNREKAWNILRAKIAARRREEREREVAELRRTLMGGVGRTGREDKVRTYNFSQSRCTDHRSGEESNNLDEVLRGGESLERIMESVREWMREGEVMTLVAEQENEKRMKNK